MSELTTTISTVLISKPPGIFSVRPDATVYQAIEIMADKQVGALLVMERDELVGILSERDYARKIILKGRSSKETPVAEIMTSSVITVTPRHTIADCMRIVTENRVRHLPVAHAGAIVGIISIGDLVNWIITEQQETIRQLEAYISGIAT